MISTGSTNIIKVTFQLQSQVSKYDGEWNPYDVQDTVDEIRWVNYTKFAFEDQSYDTQSVHCKGMENVKCVNSYTSQKLISWFYFH
jgi:hypothetical protein